MAPKLTVNDASDTLSAAMRNPAPAGDRVCRICHAFHDPAFERCFSCGRQPDVIDVVVPITYALAGGQMYRALFDYKNDPFERVQRHHAIRLAAVLWRFLDAHEKCVAGAAGVAEFDVVTTVPSKTTERDERRPWLRRIVGEWVGATSSRWRRVLRPNDPPVTGRFYDAGRYVGTAPLDGQRVLLIDDLWVTGSSIQSAAKALRQAGATHVAAVVIGRYQKPDFGGSWGTVRDLYDALPRRFDWDTCAVH